MKNLLSILLLLAGVAVSGQPVPLNPDVLYGRLENGLTYYIHKNSLPKERAMFYMVVNAGAINENEDQNGLAHFCEHMAFNGTKAFPDKGILNYLQSIGVSFGGGLNAYTSSTQTVYTLNDIPTVREGYIDSSLLILREWAANVTYSDEEINKERGVIHEEWRTSGGAGRRMSEITNKVLYQNSKYANHNTIGDINVIDNSSPEFLRDYYKKWYRPDLQAIIVVGDIDKEAIRGKIEKLFSDIPKRSAKPEDPRTIVSGNKDPLYTIATDKEATGLTIMMIIKHPGLENKDLEYLKSRLVYSLYNSMLSDRISQILQKENPPMLSSSSGYGGFTKYQDSYSTYIYALPGDPIRSFKAAMTENERVKRHGFTATELERAKTRMLVSSERQYNEREKQLSGSFVGGYLSHFTSGYPAPGIAYSFELAKSFLPTVTLQQVNSLAGKWMTDENQVFVVTGPEKEGVKIPTVDELKLAREEVLKSAIEPYTEAALPSTLIKDELKGSPVIKEEYIKDIDGTKLTLANGATIWLKYTNNKADEINMSAYSYGGYSLIPVEDLPSAQLSSTAKTMCGLGDFSYQDLRKYLTGKIASVSASLSELEEMLTGMSTMKDFETMMQLTYLQFKPARKDDEVLRSMIQRSKAALENRSSNPNSVYSDTLQMLLTNYSPRTFLPSNEYYDAINFEKTYSIANDRFKDAGDFKFVFIGNIDIPKMKPLIEKYIGSIPDDSREEFWIDHKVGPKKEHFVKKIDVVMKDPKAMNYVYYFGEFPCTPENVEYLNAIRYILNMRYVESIREKEGGTYGVGVSASLVSRPVNNFRVTMSFTCAPDRADYLRGLLIEEINNLKTKGVTEDEVLKTREFFLTDDEVRLKNNSFIMDRVKNFINNGVYTPLPEYSTKIYEDLNGKKIQELANKVFKDNYFEFVMQPKATQ